MANQPCTVKQALNFLETELFAAKIDNTKFNAELMLCELLGCDRAHVYLQLDVELDSAQIMTLRKW